jgi:hypothetical protein
MLFRYFAIQLLVGVAGAILLSVVGSRKLALRLLLVVPLAGEIALSVGTEFSAAPTTSKLPGPLNPVYWLGFALFYVHGVVLDGTWAVVLGELGWMVLRVTRLPKLFSFALLASAGAVVGALIGCAYQIGIHELSALDLAAAHVSVRAPFSQSAPSWLSAAIAGGIVGGILVAYYSIHEREPRS